MNPRPDSKPIRLLLDDDVLADGALSSIGEDRFEHQAIAERVAELTLVAKPPVNIALFGPWGSGKSSFYRLMRHSILARESKTQVVRYDAWKFGGQALKKNFLVTLARKLHADVDEYDRALNTDAETSALDWWKFFSSDWKVLGVPILLALGTAVVWAVLTVAVMSANSADSLAELLRKSLPDDLKVFGATAAALIVGEKVFETAKRKNTRPAASSDDAFSLTFKRLIDDKIKQNQRLVVFIDELDRCSPEDVVATLIDLKTFLDQDRCIFVVAADREVLERALSKVPQTTPLREEEPYYSTAGAFLDKIFQHQIALPPLRTGTLTRFARDLVKDKGGLWEDLREAEPRQALLNTIVYALVPAHVRSPRRVKIILNNFATNARIVQGRGIDWLPRAAEIAKLTVLQTEFPEVAAALLQQPRLPSLLLEPPDSPSQSLKRLLQRFDAIPSENEEEADSAAGALLHDSATSDNDRSEPTRSQETKRTKMRLNAELLRYLGKTRRLPIPKPDLVYLQTAGLLDGLANAELGRVIDDAADLDPPDTVEAFAAATSKDRATATVLLAQRSKPAGANRCCTCLTSQRSHRPRSRSASPAWTTCSWHSQATAPKHPPPGRVADGVRHDRRRLQPTRDPGAVGFAGHPRCPGHPGRGRSKPDRVPQGAAAAGLLHHPAGGVRADVPLRVRGRRVPIPDRPLRRLPDAWDLRPDRRVRGYRHRGRAGHRHAIGAAGTLPVPADGPLSGPCRPDAGGPGPQRVRRGPHDHRRIRDRLPSPHRHLAPAGRDASRAAVRLLAVVGVRHPRACHRRPRDSAGGRVPRSRAAGLRLVRLHPGRHHARLAAGLRRPPTSVGDRLRCPRPRPWRPHRLLRVAEPGLVRGHRDGVRAPRRSALPALPTPQWASAPTAPPTLGTRHCLHPQQHRRCS